MKITPPTGLLHKTLGTSSRLRCGKREEKFNHYINRQRKVRVVGIVSSFVLIILSALFIYPIVKNSNLAEAASAQDSTTTLNITTGASASVELLVTDEDGSFAKSTTDQLANFSVTTNNASGYKLVIKGSDASYANLTNSSVTPSASLTSISSSMDESSFSSYTLSSNQGIWGYKPSKLNGTTNNNYKGAPDNTTGDTIDTTSVANATAGADNTYTIGLGVKANYATAAGTYTNTYVITATGNGTPYSIIYADNSGDSTVANIPAIQQSTEGVSTTTVELTSSEPTRTGYSFSGWCEGTVSNAGTSCSGTTYAPGDDFGIDRTSTSNATTLYAVWTINQYTCTKQYRLQNADGTWGDYTTDTTEQVAYGSTCSYSKTVTNYKGSDSGSNGSAATTSGTTTASGLTLQVSLYRNTYTVTVTNSNTTSGASSLTVRYGGSATVTVTPSSGYYLSAVSCPTGYTCTGYSTGSSYTSQQTVTVTNNNSTATSNTLSFTGTIAAPYIQDYTKATCSSKASSAAQTVIDKRDNNTYTVRYINGNCWMTQNLRYVGDTVGSSSTTSTWYLKSATSNVSADTTMSMTDLTSGNTYDAARFHVATSDQVPSGADFTATDMGVWYNYAAASAMTITGSSNTSTQTYDICPKGWRLPTNSEQSGITSYSSRYSPVTGGYYYNGSLNGTGNGIWWSAASGSSTSRYNLYYNGSSLTTGYNNRCNGHYVRCIRSS